jgi:hypothetical protein
MNLIETAPVIETRDLSKACGRFDAVSGVSLSVPSAGKILFLLAAVSPPMFVLDMALAFASGFPPAHSALVLAYKELYVFAFLVVPLVALAATARNMTELALMIGALLVAYAATSKRALLSPPFSVKTG